METAGNVLAAKGLNEDLRDRLEEYKDTDGLTLGSIAKQIGTNEAAISRYLDGHPLGDVAKLEARIADFLASAARRRAWGELFFETKAVEMCNLAFDLIRESGDVGLVHGPAGIGKSTTCKQYAKTHPTAIFYTAMQGQGADWNVIRMISNALPPPRSDEDKRLKKADWVMKKLRGSRRLVIIDNAQRISLAGLRWLMDFNDETACPVALVGNPEVLDKIKHSDQMSSRVGFKQDIADMMKMNGAWINAAADKMVAAMWPEAASEIRSLSHEAARRTGYLRTLNKQLRIAMRLCESESYRGRYGKAFSDARSLIGAGEED